MNNKSLIYYFYVFWILTSYMFVRPVYTWCLLLSKNDNVFFALNLQTVVSWHMVLGIEPNLKEEIQVLLTAKPILQFLVDILFSLFFICIY